MAKILVLVEQIDNTTEYIRHILGDAFNKADIEYKFQYLKYIGENDLNWCDILLAIRPTTPLSFDIAGIIKNSNRLYVVLYDDDLLNFDFLPLYYRKCVKKILELADVLLTSNLLIKEEYQNYLINKRAVIFNTPISKEQITRKNLTKNDKLHFVYAAGKDHVEFFEKYIKKNLEKFIQKYRDKVHFTFIGVKPELGDIKFQDHFTFIPLLPMDEYNKIMREGNFDIGLAPLSNNRFTNRKYFNKYIEYSRFAICGLYSNCLPYTLAVKNKINGILVDNNIQAWYEALCFCVENYGVCQECVRKSQLDIKNKFSVEEFIKILNHNIPEIKKENLNKKTIKYTNNIFIFYCLYLQEKLLKVLWFYRQKGMKATIRKIKNAIINKIKR